MSSNWESVPSEVKQGNVSARERSGRVSKHKSVLIPGPVEFDEKVLSAMSHASEPHTCQDFADIFSSTLKMLRPVFQTKNESAQPFIISGSGILGMDMVASSLIEGDKSADLTYLEAGPGELIALQDIEILLREEEYGIVIVTHTETSTGFRNDVEQIAHSVRKLSPSSLIVVDGVCSVGVEDLRFDEWDLDVVITCSQKGLGCPAGLSILMVGPRALNKIQSRKSPIPGFYTSLANWLPVMQSYEAKKAAFFATPSSHLIRALNCALRQILETPLQERFEAHERTSDRVKDCISRLGLQQVVKDPKYQCNSMTAFYLPEDVDSKYVLQRMNDEGFYLAGGIHVLLGSRYIRLGHMGVSVMDESRDEIKKALDVLETVHTEGGHHMMMCWNDSPFSETKFIALL